uniref:Uncharacterized protein n=1 Tax=Oryza barthii TaxID=65489 RepID=A0A0D3F4E7_9ORYZ
MAGGNTAQLRIAKVFVKMDGPSQHRGSINTALSQCDQGDTFDHLTTWIEEARRLGVGGAKLTICFIGNKCDLSDRRAVSYEEGEQFAKQNALLFIEASAKAAHNVNEHGVFKSGYLAPS